VTKPGGGRNTNPIGEVLSLPECAKDQKHYEYGHYSCRKEVSGIEERRSPTTSPSVFLAIGLCCFTLAGLNFAALPLLAFFFAERLVSVIYGHSQGSSDHLPDLKRTCYRESAT
jgi:hypothetical protein